MLDRIRDAVTALPALPDDLSRYSPRLLTAAWLAEQRSAHTRREYFKDLSKWLAWCQTTDLDPFMARPADVGVFRSQQSNAASTVARRLSALSSWYRYLIANDAATSNPVAATRRPQVDRDASTTVGLSLAEGRNLLAAADAATGRTAPRTRALIRLLACTGLRVGEALSLDVDALGHNRGYRTLHYTAKGGKIRERPLDGHATDAIEKYLADRARRGLPMAGPLFATEPGTGAIGRLDEPAAFRLIRRLALTAGIASASRLSPHSLRHMFATVALDEGVELRDVQDSLGHADPRTTRRYDAGRNALARDASLRVGSLFARTACPTEDTCDPASKTETITTHLLADSRPGLPTASQYDALPSRPVAS